MAGHLATGGLSPDSMLPDFLQLGIYVRDQPPENVIGDSTLQEEILQGASRHEQALAVSDGQFLIRRWGYRPFSSIPRTVWAAARVTSSL